MSISILELPILRHARRLVADSLLSATAFAAVTILPVLHTDIFDSAANLRSVLSDLALYTLIAALVFGVFRTSRMLWQFVSFNDLLKLIGAATATVVLFAGLQLAISLRQPAPITLWVPLLFLLWTANIGLLAAPRLIARAVAELQWFRRTRRLPRNITSAALLTGDIDRIEAFIRESGRDAASEHVIVGVLTDQANLHGSYLQGVEVLGSPKELEMIMARLSAHGVNPTAMILAKDDASHLELESFLDSANRCQLNVARLPPRGILQGATAVRPIELTDLLGRPEVVTDVGAIEALVRNRVVLITGAGGSIGSELVRQVARFKPKTLIVLDLGEYNLYSIDQELSINHPGLAYEAVLGDVRDVQLIGALIERVRPNIVFHAAALKHVPLVEHNPIEGVKTNVFGTVNVAESCMRCGVACMITISTDKAVNPTNVMGATKRLAEAYCQGLDQSPEFGATRFVTVRFGNVLGSAGSVVPLFQRQIESGGPITITHPDITRYFMTIPEAVRLVLQAGAHGATLTEERGSIYVLEMGRPVKIVDLARQMVRLSGKRPDVDVKIKVIGLRPGEKLFEELAHNEEEFLPTGTPSIMKLAPRVTDLRIIRQQISELRQAATIGDRARVLRLLRVSVPEFTAEDRESVG